VEGAESLGYPYRNLEERSRASGAEAEAGRPTLYAKELAEAMAARKAEVGRVTGGRHGHRDTLIMTNAEDLRDRRKDAEAIQAAAQPRVENGGVPMVVRAKPEPTPVTEVKIDKERQTPKPTPRSFRNPERKPKPSV